MAGPDAGPRRIPTYVVAGDPISRAGLAAQLRGRHDLAVVDDVERAAVAVLVADAVDEAAAQAVRALLGRGLLDVLVVATAIDDRGVRRAAEAGACAVLRRVDASPEKLAAVVVSAVHGHGAPQPDLLGSAPPEVGHPRQDPHRRGDAPAGGFSEREVEVLRLVADGLDTAEIAGRLACSERTVKNVIHDVTARYGLRNRCHAIAYALRAGVI
ncbi:MAG TPA: LuxR C-terminal-related transcriptional regulator [Acidimicrobiales bacterium]|nr:LuxR C-terminal-related transcriptional regulator [Acidimicrobiales bacterium]